MSGEKIKNLENQNSQAEVKKNNETELKLNSLKISILKEKAMPIMGQIEGFERGMDLLDHPNVSASQLNDVMQILNNIMNLGGQKMIDLIQRIDDDGFFSDLGGLSKFISKYGEFKDIKKDFEIKKDFQKNEETARKNEETARKNEETARKNEETARLKNDIIEIRKGYIDDVLNKFKKGNFSEEFKENLMFLENCKKLSGSPEDVAKMREIVLALLKEIKAKEVSTNDKKYKELFASVAVDFKAAGIITDGDIVKLSTDANKLVESTKNIDEKLKPFDGFTKMDDDGKMYFRHNGKSETNDIISYDDKGRVSEKIASSKSGYELKIEEPVALTRDISILIVKIREIDSQIIKIDENLKVLAESFENIKKKPIPTVDEKRFLENFANNKKQLEAARNVLSERLVIMKKRLEKYEDEANVKSNKIEEKEKSKNILRNKIQMLDVIGFTVLPQNILDKILIVMERETGIKDDKSFYENLTPEKFTKLRNFFIKILQVKENMLFKEGTNILNYPFNEKKTLIRALQEPPKVLDEGMEFSEEALKTRLGLGIKQNEKSQGNQ